MKNLTSSLALCAVLISSGASAALVDRGGGLIYDTDLNVTWLSNASVNGPMIWTQANTWAANFSYYDSVREVTYTDWRLPTVSPDGKSSSEMGHLFYNELGGVADHANYSLFQNFQRGGYWTGTTFVPGPYDAWTFNFRNGSQNFSYKQGNFYALAVRPGDVAAMPASPVPVPAAAWLLGSGLLGLIGVARRNA